MSLNSSLSVEIAGADLVGQQHPAAHLLEHLLDSFDLEPIALDVVQRVQAEQVLKCPQQGEMMEIEPGAERGKAGRIRRIGNGLHRIIRKT